MLSILKRTGIFKNIKVLALFNAGVLFILDYITKNLALLNLGYNKTTHLISINISELTVGLNFYLTYNRGTAFSIIKQASSQTTLLLIMGSCLICMILLYMLYRESSSNKPEIFAIGCILGGALGNIFDRVNYGYVIDFIDMYANQHHWPIFNVADMAISLGVIILASRLLFSRNKY